MQCACCCAYRVYEGRGPFWAPVPLIQMFPSFFGKQVTPTDPLLPCVAYCDVHQTDLAPAYPVTSDSSRQWWSGRHCGDAFRRTPVDWHVSDGRWVQVLVGGWGATMMIDPLPRPNLRPCAKVCQCKYTPSLGDVTCYVSKWIPVDNWFDSTTWLYPNFHPAMPCRHRGLSDCRWLACSNSWQRKNRDSFNDNPTLPIPAFHLRRHTTAILGSASCLVGPLPWVIS